MKEIREQLLDDLAKAGTPREVEEVRIRYLGRKGAITTLAKGTDFSKMSPDEKRAVRPEAQRVEDARRRKRSPGRPRPRRTGWQRPAPTRTRQGSI